MKCQPLTGNDVEGVHLLIQCYHEAIPRKDAIHAVRVNTGEVLPSQNLSEHEQKKLAIDMQFQEHSEVIHWRTEQNYIAICNLGKYYISTCNLGEY